MKVSASDRRSIIILITAALFCISALMSVNTPALPITLLNLFVVTFSGLTGGLTGTGAAGIYLILGSLGLPVFPVLKGGFSCITGPSGGFLAGCFIASLVTGLISGTPFSFEKHLTSRIIIRNLTACAAGYICVWIPSILWYMRSVELQGNGITFSQAFEICLKPYLLLEAAKFMFSSAICIVLRPKAAKILYPAEEEQEILNRLSRKK